MASLQRSSGSSPVRTVLKEHRDPVIDDRLRAKLTVLLQREADRFRERGRAGLRGHDSPLA
jgi:hypothetical protein